MIQTVVTTVWLYSRTCDKSTRRRHQVQTQRIKCPLPELNHFTMDRCVNCRVPCDGTYCCICQNLTECQKCGRRLSAQLYTQRDDVCNTCVRRNQRSTHRTAMEGVVEEYDIPTSETDVDLHVFIDQHEDDITRILDEAVNRHEWVERNILWNINV